ncbi:hypothetical protein FS837_008880 [Tulasnella sp. UAMH 9824]|nr:hypothetical protein FS837_008880 [Tulasnella sp. UAMH 9824]
MVAVTLLKCDPDEVKLLFDVLEDIKGSLEDAGPRSTKMPEMNTIKDVLNKTLESYQWSGDGAVTRGSQGPSGSECDAGEVKHHMDGLGEEQWEFERLCRWCGLADMKPATGTSGEAGASDIPLAETTQGLRNSRSIFILPDELLQHIFRLAARSRIWVRAPLVLSHVNSDFRSIVLNTPSLWTYIDESLSLQMRDLYIARSKDLPLDVLTRLDRREQESSGSDGEWIDFLEDESSRIGQITVVGNDPGRILAWGRQVKGIVFTSLTKLAVCLSNDQNSIAACPKWACFPHLQDLWIRGYWCRGWVGKGDPFPPDLRRLSLSKVTAVSTPVLLKALDGVPGLLSLTMEDLYLDLEEQYPPLMGGVTLASLEKLEFTNVPVTDMSSISLSVSTPNLSSLSLIYSGSSNRIIDFLAPFTAEHPQISSLRLLGFNLGLQELKVVLRNLANLVHIRVSASSLTDNDLTLLKKGNLLPRFTQISS